MKILKIKCELMVKNYKHEGNYYVNFCFKNIVYDKKTYAAHFIAPDYDIECDFIYMRETDDILVMNNKKPVEETLPIPVHWLDMKLRE